jgi:filamentous hemagglutinin family protein
MAVGSSKVVTAAAGFLIFGLIGTAYAEVATDGTVGPRVRLGGPEFRIGADLGTRAGRNLFHSFQRFSLETGERATFSGPDQIRNVISRVTGGVRSDIDGTLHSTIPGADFYFINPAGVVFGPNASLDVKGSFHVSTADELRFADGAKFSATDPTASSFTVARPEAFGFLGAHKPAPILVDRSTLAVPTGEALSIVGGDIRVAGVVGSAPDFPILNAFIEAEAGAITLAAVGGPGEVQPGTGAVAAIRQANIKLEHAFVGTSQRPSPNDVADVAPDRGGGSVTIRADRLLMNGVRVETSTDSIGDGGRLDIKVRAFELSDSFLSADTLGSADAGEVRVEATESVSCVFCGISSATFASGRGGSVTVEANKLEITADGFISANTFGSGDGGQVVIRAAEVTIDFGSIGNAVFAEGDPREATGNSGVVIVEAGHLTVRNGFIETSSFGAGDAGAVTVTADRINLAGGQISSAVLSGTGRGGDVTVTARDELVISGRSTIFRDGRTNQPLPSGIFAASEPNDAGRGGTVTIAAPVLMIADGGEVSAASFGTDRAGSVTINAETLQMDNAKISTESKAGGGRIVIRNSRVTALRDSQILTTIGQAGGSLEIEADVVVLDSSDILLTSEQPAFLPTVGHLLRSPDSKIILNSAPFDLSGVQDTIEIDAGPPTLIVAPPLWERCSSRSDIGASSFTGVGRAGLPPSPDGPLASAYVVDEAAVGTARNAGSRLATVTAPADVRLAGLSAPCAPLD